MPRLCCTCAASLCLCLPWCLHLPGKAYTVLYANLPGKAYTVLYANLPGKAYTVLYANLPGKAAFLEELKDADINEMIPRIVAKIKEYERRKAAKALVARRLLTYVWRRRIRKLRELKKRADEQARRDAAMSI